MLNSILNFKNGKIIKKINVDEYIYTESHKEVLNINTDKITYILNEEIEKDLKDRRLLKSLLVAVFSILFTLVVFKILFTKEVSVMCGIQTAISRDSWFCKEGLLYSLYVFGIEMPTRYVGGIFNFKFILLIIYLVVMVIVIFYIQCINSKRYYLLRKNEIKGEEQYFLVLVDELRSNYIKDNKHVLEINKDEYLKIITKLQKDTENLMKQLEDYDMLVTKEVIKSLTGD